MSLAVQSRARTVSAPGGPAANGSLPRPLHAQLAYWKAQPDGGLGALELPADRPRAATQCFHAGDHCFALSGHLSSAVNALSRAENVSSFATLLAVFQTLLHRHTGSEEFVIGTVSVRSSRNPLALRARFHGNPSFREILARAEQTARDAFANQDVPFVLVRSELPAGTNGTDTPFFRAAFALGSDTATPLPKARCDLALALTETDEHLEGRFQYNADLFDGDSIQRLVRQYETLLEAVTADPMRPVSSLPLLTATERRQLLLEWNDTGVLLPPDPDLPHLFEEQAARTPEAVAVECGDRQFTYSELNLRANQLAHYLRGLGVGPDVLVGVGVERSLEMVVAVLGVLKAGGAYVPLDPAFPKERLEYMASDAGLSILLTQDSLVADMPQGDARVIRIDTDWPAISREPGTTPPVQNEHHHLAYVIYTSGSTGRPKGVMVRRDALVNFLISMRRNPGFTERDSMLALTTLSFDISKLEIFLPLITGGRTIIVSRAAAADSAQLVQLLARAHVTVLQATPATFQLLREAGWKGNRHLKILSGGEALSRELADWLLTCGESVWNVYGPTETTVYSMCEKVEPGGAVLIGRPIDNTQIYILNPQLEPMPVGVPGELHIGGAGLARGYRNQPELTAAKFIPDPFRPQSDARLYKTGDLARYRADGRVECLGRIDHQVKVRGYRIELGEIESVLGRHPAVRQSVVIVREDRPGDKRIVAYLVPTSGEQPPVTALRQLAATHLPPYMVPGDFVFLTTLPLTPSGKVNRRALPAPAETSATHAFDATPPRTPVEEKLLALWREILGRKQAGIHDNFFESGGHSLLATRLISRVRDTWQIELSLQNIFETPTVAGLAGAVALLCQTSPTSPATPLRSSSQDVHPRISLHQERAWFVCQLEPDSPALNMPVELRLNGPLHRPALEKSLGEIVRRHESLRTTFRTVSGRPDVSILPPWPVDLTPLDLRSLAPEARADAVRLQTNEEARRLFDLARGPLFRCQLLRLGEEEHLLLLTTHHIVSDGWSTNLLLEEIGVLYSAFREGRPSPRPELSAQYSDFAKWQREFSRSGAFDQQLAYWKEQLAGDLPVLELPLDFPRPARQTFRDGVVNLSLPPTLIEALTEMGRRENATLYMTLLTVYQVLLHRLSGQEDIVVGSPIAGRRHSELERLIGLFVNMLALRNNFSGTPTFRQALARTRTTALGAFSHQDITIDRLVEELHPTRDLSHSPLFQVMFNHVNLDEASTSLAGLEVGIFIPPEPGAKYDLNLYVEQQSGGVGLQLVYNASLFTPERMRELLRQFSHLLEQVVAQPDTLVDRFSLVTPASKTILPNPVEKISTKPELPAHTAFFEQAARTPENIALSGPRGTCTYGRLAAHAGRLAQKLRADGRQEGDLVAVYAQRSPALVWALLGTLQSGAAFLILDPAHPEARLLDCLRLAKPRGWLQLEEAGAVPPALEEFTRSTGLRPLTLPPLERAENFLADFSTPTAATPANEDAPAYVTFTSGSTGVPKGIVGTHQPLAHFLQWHVEHSGFTAADRFTMLSGLAHDPLLRDIFTPLRIGATLCVPDSMESSAALIAWFERERISATHLTPQTAQLLTDGAGPGKELPALRRAFFGGDILTRSVVAKLSALAPSVECVNFYGATETPQAMGFCPVAKNSSGPERIPVGRGIDGVQLLVVNRAGQRAGVGETGEIVIRTPHLARGYLGDPGLTAERFAANPFTRDAADRCYQTGDLGRYLPDGNLEILGRADRQIKLRGFRIEPGEIEAALRRHPGVQNAAVLLHEEQLVAWIVATPGAAPGTTELRNFLAGLLPQYMVPGIFTAISGLPITPNGKLDTKALRQQFGGFTGTSGEAVQPTTPVQVQILRIWQELLPGRTIGMRDNFFEVGGHSLLAVQMIDRIEKECGHKLPLALIFSAATVEQLADRLAQEEINQARPLVELQTGGSRTPFFFLHGDLAGGGFYTQKISRHLGPDQPFYVLPPSRMAEGAVASVEALAAEHVRIIREHTPRGPYGLGGYCAGGLIAFEMARQLQAAGEKVSHLILIDAPAGIGLRPFARKVIDTFGSWRRTSLEMKLHQLYVFSHWEKRWNELSAQGFRAQSRFLMSKIAAAFRRDRTQPFPPPAPRGEPRAMDESSPIFAAYVWSVAGYRARPYDGPATLIWAEADISGQAAELKRWRRLIPRLEIKTVPGDHLTSVTQYADVMAGLFRANFNRPGPG